MKLRYILLLTCLINFACGGDGDSGDSEDFFDIVPSESLNPAVNGDWEFEATISSSTCTGVTEGTTTSGTYSVQIFTDEDCNNLWDPADLPDGITLDDFHCEVGGNVIAARYDITMEIEGECELSYSTDELWQLDESDTDKMKGVITADYSISEECRVEPGTSRKCKSVIDVEASRLDEASSTEFLRKGKMPILNLFDVNEVVVNPIE